MPKIIHLSETDSTNNYLKQLLLDTTPAEGTVVCTDHQISGRGQRGNGWEAEDGKNLLFSTVLYPNHIKANQQFVLSQISALAIKRVLDKYTDGISVKWSNDIYWQDKKICGILIENSLLGDSIQQSVIGIGININQTSFSGNVPNPISLKGITGRDYNLKSILSEIRREIEILYDATKKRETSHIARLYKESLYRRSGYHLYNDGKTDFWARFLDIEPSGQLVLETSEGAIRRFAFKEVKFIIPCA